MKIGTKLGLGFGFSILITIIVGYFALFEMHTLKNLTKNMYMHPLTVSNAVRDIRADIIAMHRSMKDVALAENKEQIDEAAEIVNQYEQQVYHNFDIVADRFLGNLSKVEYTRQIFSEWKTIRDEVISLSKQGKRKEAADITRGRGALHVDFMMSEIDGLIDFATSKSNEFLSNAEQEIQKANTILTGFLFFMVLLGIISSISITRSIAVPLGVIVEKIKTLSRGKLTESIEIHRNDEVGKLADSFRDLQKDLFDRTRLLGKIASGDFSNNIPLRSEEDDLGKSFFAMTSSLRKAKDELASSELRYYNLTEALPVGIAVSTIGGELIETNSAIIQMFELESKEEFISYPAIEFWYDPEDRNTFIELNKKGSLKEFECRFKRKNGTYFWGSISSVSQNSEIYGTLFITSFMDISERKKAEESLIRERMFVSLLQIITAAANESSTLGEAMQVCLDEVCTLMNWPIGHVYMPSEDDKILIPTELWHIDNPEKFKDFRDATERSTFTLGIGLPGRILSNKQPSWISDVNNDPEFLRTKLVENLGVKAAFAFPVLLGNEVVAVLEFFAKSEANADEKLLEVMASIGKQLGRVVERTRAKEILKNAKIEAESSNIAKSNFLSSMSHELRTPLNAILGFSQVLDGEFEGKLNESQKNYIQDIIVSGKHLLSLINDILDLSKIEENKQELHLEVLNITEILNNSLIMIREHCNRQNITLNLELDSSIDNLLIKADTRKIKQILYNLLSNAVKFTPADGNIIIKASKSSGFLKIAVSDSGIGIEKENIDKIFQKFYQTEGGIINKTKGTGLGLNIVKNLVELHGGKLEVQSDGRNKGAVFTVTIPSRQKG